MVNAQGQQSGKSGNKDFLGGNCGKFAGPRHVQMKTNEFVSKLDEAQIVRAIADAESRSSGEIRVFVAHDRVKDALADARHKFNRLKMTATRERNGVLIYVAPRTQQFAVWADIGIHEKCGDAVWHEIVASATKLLKEGKFTEAIIDAIQKTAAVLAQHFPRKPDDKNELPDNVVFG